MVAFAGPKKWSAAPPPPPAATSLVHKPSATPRHAFRENINFYHMLIQETNSCVCRFEEVSFFAMAGI